MKMVFVSGGNGKEDAQSQGGCGGNGKAPTIIYYDTTYKTNADRIRAMTDEELADLFDTWVRDCDCNDVPCREYCLPNRYDCVQNWLDWLKQEATL